MLLVVLAQFAPVLVGRVYRFEDIAGYFEPLWTAAARAMAAGHWPLWDRGAWGGQPIAADPQAGIFYPPNWLWLVLPVLRAYAVLIVAHAAFGALGMYALVRWRGGSQAAATLAGIALGAGAYVVLQTRHIMFVEATAWIPWVAAFGWRFLDGGGRRWLAALAAAIGMTLLTGGVSMIYYGAWFVAAVLLARVAALSPEKRLRAVFGLALAGALGVALAGPMLWPMLAHAPLSPRALGVDNHFASQFAWPSYGFAVTLFLPNAFGDQSIGTWRGGFVQWELASYYAGMIPFALAGYWLVRGERVRRGERIALGALALLAIGLAREHSIVHRAAYHLLPLISSMRCPARALYVFTFIVPLLGADGFDRLSLRLSPSWRRVWPWIGVALLSIDLLVAHRHWNPSLTLAEAEAAGRPEAVDFLARHPGDRFVNDVHLDHALHGGGLLWGLDGASGYSSLPIWRYLHYLWIANHGAVYPHPKVHDDLSAQGLWRLSSPLVDALAVRFVITSKPPDGPGFVKRFAGEDGVDVWENEEALPRAYVVHQARVVDGAAAAARAIAEARFDPRGEVIIEEEPSVAPDGNGNADFLYRVSGVVSAGAEGNGNGNVGPVVWTGPAALEVEARLARPGILVLAEPAYPGWSATVDGAPAKILVANYALCGVALTAGTHRVAMVLSSRPVDRGLFVGVAALALILALGFPRRR